MDWYVDSDDTAALRQLRRAVRTYLDRHSTEGADVEGAELIASELVTNAASHAGGPIWVSITWAGARPTLTVYDLGPGFDLEARLPDDPVALGGGRGLFIVSRLAKELTQASRRAGGSAVSAVLPVTRPSSESFEPQPLTTTALPDLDEAAPGGGFGRETFLRALVVQLAQAIELLEGPSAAEAAVTQVGTDVGGQMEAEYRLARQIVGAMSPEQMGDCYVRLKHAIDGDFHVVEATPERIVLVNDRCPFGDVVRRAPTLCRMTSSVFGGIAARNSERGAVVALEERIAIGDPQCRVTVWLDVDVDVEAGDEGLAGVPAWAHRYPSVT